MEHLAKFRHSNVRKRVTMNLGEAATRNDRTRPAVPTGNLARAEG